MLNVYPNPHLPGRLHHVLGYLRQVTQKRTLLRQDSVPMPIDTGMKWLPWLPGSWGSQGEKEVPTEAAPGQGSQIE